MCVKALKFHMLACSLVSENIIYRLYIKSELFGPDHVRIYKHFNFRIFEIFIGHRQLINNARGKRVEIILIYSYNCWIC